MMDSISEQNYVDIPQWKKDLIARLKNSAHKVISTASVEQCKLSHSEVSTIKNTTDVAIPSRGSELYWFDQKGEESDSDDLHYGPGIVRKLKNKYLSLALRESNPRPSILQLRKATSLENVLEDEIFPGSKQYEPHDGNSRKNIPKRYGHTNRTEMKRARSVETISRLEDVSASSKNTNRQSFHEGMIVDVDNENDFCIKKSQNNNHVESNLGSKSNSLYTNRPKRLQPILNENEKPPPEFVKQAKMLFERRPEQRTRPPVQTGDVAAKVHNFNTIIVKAKVEAKVSKKQLNKHNKSDKISSVRPIPSKTSVNADQHKYIKTKSLVDAKSAIKKEPSLPSPIPDVSMIEFPKNGVDENNKNTSLSETPDLILTSSPVLNASLAKSRSNSHTRDEFDNPTPLSDNDISKRLVSPASSPTSLKPSRPQYRPSTPPKLPMNHMEFPTDNKIVPINEVDSLVHQMNEKNADSLSLVITNAPTIEPTLSPQIASAESTIIKPDINDLKSSVPRAKAVNKNVVVKKPAHLEQSQTMIFNFKNRKDVPDYISNNQSKPLVPLLPKPGDGEIILLPTSNFDLLIDEDEELIKSLQGPPSPCDVIFINDNILIDGKSSLVQRTKQNKLNISFVEEADVYEYPSETSLMLEETPSSPQAQVGSSMLSNYIPKGTEEFQPGVTRTAQTVRSSKPDIVEVEQMPVVLMKETSTPFSSGTNPDILF